MSQLPIQAEEHLQAKEGIVLDAEGRPLSDGSGKPFDDRIFTSFSAGNGAFQVRQIRLSGWPAALGLLIGLPILVVFGFGVLTLVLGIFLIFGLFRLFIR